MVEPVGAPQPAAQQQIRKARERREKAPDAAPVAGDEEEIRQAGVRMAELLSGLAAISNPQPPPKQLPPEDVETFLGGKGRGKSVDIII